MTNPLNIAVLLACALLVGCSGTRIGDALELPLHEYERKYGSLQNWSIEDIHVHVNRVVADRHYDPKRPELNGFCLETAEMKFDLAREAGHNTSDYRVITIRLHPDIVSLRSPDSPTHAVLEVGDTIYDNGFLAGHDTPFHASELKRYGVEIPNVWSEAKYR